MGFRPGAYLTVWEINNKGKYSLVSLTSSKKSADGKYEKDWSNKFVRFVGNAHEMISKVAFAEGDHFQIKLGEDWHAFDVTNNYVAETKTLYTNYTVFNFEFAGEEPIKLADGVSSSDSEGFMSIPADIDEELPFA